MTKSKKNSKTWSCDKGCNLDRGICKHLESLLPSTKNGMISQDTLQTYSALNEVLEPNFDYKCALLESGLQDLGLAIIESKIIVDHMVSGLTFKELASKYGTTINLIYDLVTEVKDKMNSKQFKKALQEYFNE